MDPSLSLPLELFQLVWDHLSNDIPEDRQCLASCSLVCHDWRTPTQRALFSRTPIINDYIRKHELLSAFPNIQPMVLDLDVTLNLDRSEESIEALAAILELLPNLRALELRGQRDSGSGEALLSWSVESTAGPIIRSMATLASRPSFSKLALHNFFTFVVTDNWRFHRFLAHAKHLKSLHLIGGGIMNTSHRLTVPPDPPVEPIVLESLSLLSGSFVTLDTRLDGSEWESYLYPFDFNALKELIIENGQKYFCDLPNKMPSLEKLTVISGSSRIPGSTHAVDLSQTSPTLQSISFKFHIDRPIQDSLKWIGDSLRSLPPINNVQHLSFTIFALSRKTNGSDDFIFPNTLFNIYKDIFILLWEQIGHAIGPKNLPSLAQVKISTFGSHKESEGRNISWLEISQQAAAGLRKACYDPPSYEMKTFGEEISPMPTVKDYVYLG